MSKPKTIRASELRHGLGKLTQRQLGAAPLGVTANTIARWERGELPISAAISQRFQRHVQVGDLQYKIERLREENRQLKADLRAANDTAVERLLSTAPPQSPDNHARKLYQQLTKKYHPDRRPEYADVMSDINALWQAVSTKKP